jgi:hypothetical protein
MGFLLQCDGTNNPRCECNGGGGTPCLIYENATPEIPIQSGVGGVPSNTIISIRVFTTVTLADDETARIKLSIVDDDNYWYAEVKAGPSGYLKLFSRIGGVETERTNSDGVCTIARDAGTFGFCASLGINASIGMFTILASVTGSGAGYTTEFIQSEAAFTSGEWGVESDGTVADLSVQRYLNKCPKCSSNRTFCDRLNMIPPDMNASGAGPCIYPGEEQYSDYPLIVDFGGGGWTSVGTGISLCEVVAGEIKLVTGAIFGMICGLPSACILGWNGDDNPLFPRACLGGRYCTVINGDQRQEVLDIELTISGPNCPYDHPWALLGIRLSNFGHPDLPWVDVHYEVHLDQCQRWDLTLGAVITLTKTHESHNPVNRACDGELPDTITFRLSDTTDPQTESCLPGDPTLPPDTTVRCAEIRRCGCDTIDFIYLLVADGYVVGDIIKISTTTPDTPAGAINRPHIECWEIMKISDSNHRCIFDGVDENPLATVPRWVNIISEHATCEECLPYCNCCSSAGTDTTIDGVVVSVGDATGIDADYQYEWDHYVKGNTFVPNNHEGTFVPPGCSYGNYIQNVAEDPGRTIEFLFNVTNSNPSDPDAACSWEVTIQASGGARSNWVLTWVAFSPPAKSEVCGEMPITMNFVSGSDAVHSDFPTTLSLSPLAACPTPEV